jgi:hypothetical protein
MCKDEYKRGGFAVGKVYCSTLTNSHLTRKCAGSMGGKRNKYIQIGKCIPMNF